MAKFKAFAPVDVLALNESVSGSIMQATGSTIRVEDRGVTTIYRGDFTYQGESVFGVMRSYVERAGDQLGVRVTQQNTDIAVYAQALASGNAYKALRLMLEGDDKVVGSRGDDVLRGASGNDVMRGRAGDDMLLGDEGDDVLKGGRGDDVLIGGDGADVMRGGPGSDVFVFRRGGDGAPDVIRGFRENDTLEIDARGSGLEIETAMDGSHEVSMNGDPVVRVYGDEVDASDVFLWWL